MEIQYTNARKISDFGEIRLLSEILLEDVVGKKNDKNDDCAHLYVFGERLLWSIDPCPTPVAHWFGLDSPEVWGCYTATINLSDIAASGGTPIGMLVSLEMPDDTPVSFLKDFQFGLISTLRAAGANLLGGNVKSANKFCATGTIIGYGGEKDITRSLSCSNGTVYLVGDTGDFWTAVVGNCFGWGGLSAGNQIKLNKALCFPNAQTEAGQILGKLPFELACMDCSDGPANALYQIARINSLDINISIKTDWQLKPEYIRLLNENNISMENACYQFGDWQLLCVIPSRECNSFEKALDKFTVTKIGSATQGSGSVSHEDGRCLMESSLNQNFSDGYNSINSIEELISRFMRTPVFR
uniref:Thiamine-phosphate kinase n=1 Tax=Candidatus Kentrum sp. SD TaxID=2126332 RepID=A0A450YPH1_9GAMM|nr:MAG: thiamine-phosphate kinase [Candidatus Kentron sp. SD]VFK43461.1 MAG: thiamine-phosphate kinase [Candidatus Kentron sp. SD]VFK80635.1 MAG: thiamine-phosphate kinase [Candidatus Kentron sp. SD]